MNSLLSLAMCRLALSLALDMSEELNVDDNRRDKWNHVLKHLSTYTFQEMKGKKVFRYSEKGKAWHGGNTLGIQHIYPAGDLHLDSKPELIQVAHNMISVMGRWHDGNGSNSFFPAAVRVGYDPQKILRQLSKYAKKNRPNGIHANSWHAIENCSTVPNTVNEMLCMGHKGVIRLFPVWPRDKNASFVNIRCWGAFLVSGELKDGNIRNVSVFSEKGRDCTIVNPWPGKKVSLTRNGKKAEAVVGKRLSFSTAQSETIELKRFK